MRLSIDPGLNFCGVTVYDTSDGVFNVTHTVLIKNNRKLTEDEKLVESKYDLRTVKVLNIVETLKRLITEYSITEVTFEAPFYNSLTPMAFGSLLEVIFAIKYIVVEPNNLPMNLLEPRYVKRVFTGNSMAKKENMKEHLLIKIQNKEIILDKDFSSLSEHEIDSIAVGFSHSLSIK